MDPSPRTTPEEIIHTVCANNTFLELHRAQLCKWSPGAWVPESWSFITALDYLLILLCEKEKKPELLFRSSVETSSIFVFPQLLKNLILNPTRGHQSVGES